MELGKFPQRLQLTMYHGLSSGFSSNMWCGESISRIGRSTIVCPWGSYILSPDPSNGVFDYTDVLSAALDAGTAVGVILVFFW